MSAGAGYEPVAVTVRSGRIESVHHGAVVVLGADGAVEAMIGDADAPVYPRSSNKPMQALALLRAGLVATPPALALACASHSGEDVHLDVVRGVLAAAGLGEGALGNTPDQPLSEAACTARLRAGDGPTSLTQNCSGKHAAMLATCVANGWPTDGYLDPDHPVQLAITRTLGELIGRSEVEAGVDGCGAPAHLLSLRELATCFGAIASGAAGAAGTEVATAMRTHPDLVGGTGRDVTGFMRAVPGLLAKDGAEGVYAASLADGRCIALKIADGAGRARPVVLAAALARLGVPVGEFAEVWEQPVLGHGRPVGRVEAVGPLAEPFRRSG